MACLVATAAPAPLTWPGGRNAARLGSRALALSALLVVALGCPGGPPRETTLPLLTTDDHGAERDLAAAREAAEEGRDGEAKDLYASFLRDHADDPLRPMAQLGLGRLLLAEGRLEQADALFARVAEHEDSSVSERGRFYHGITQHLAGHEADALETLRPFVGRLVDPDESSLLMRTIAMASLAQGDRIGATEALDTLLAQGAPAPDEAEARSMMRRVIADELSHEEAQTLYRRLSRRGEAWPLAAERAARDAFAAGDLAAVERIVGEMREHDVALDAELSAMALRAERMGEADPHIIGVVLPLTGRGRRAGEQALRGLMLAAGIPAQGPVPEGAPQLVVRDSVADPEKARAAVEDLVSLHRAIAIVGPIDRSAAHAAAERAAELGVPLIALSPDESLETMGPMVFRLVATLNEEVEALTAEARRRQLSRIALLTADTPYGRAVAAAAHAVGVTPVAEARYAADHHDLRDAIDQLVSAAPDAVLLGDDPRGLQVVIPGLATRGLYCAPEGAALPRGARRVSFLLPSAAHSTRLLASASRYLQGALLSAPFDPRGAGPQAELTTQYESRYRGAPQLLTAAAYDAFRLIVAAERGDGTSRQEVAQGLVTAAATAGPSGGLTGARAPRQATRIVEVGATP